MEKTFSIFSHLVLAVWLINCFSSILLFVHLIGWLFGQIFFKNTSRFPNYFRFSVKNHLTCRLTWHLFTITTQQHSDGRPTSNTPLWSHWSMKTERPEVDLNSSPAANSRRLTTKMHFRQFHVSDFNEITSLIGLKRNKNLEAVLMFMR